MTIVAKSVSGNAFRGRAFFAAIFLGSEKLSAGEDRPLPLQISPVGLRHLSPGKEQPVPLEDSRTNPKPGSREPDALGRLKSPGIVRVQLVLSAKAPPGPVYFPPEGDRLSPLDLPLGQQYRPSGEGQLLLLNSPPNSYNYPPNDIPFSPQLPTKLSPKTSSDNETAVEEFKQGLVDVYARFSLRDQNVCRFWRESTLPRYSIQS